MSSNDPKQGTLFAGLDCLAGQLDLFPTDGHLEPDDTPAADLFGPVIYSYTRRQAIEDGVLVQLSGPGYEGDEWVPAMVAEAGITVPLAMTAEAFYQCVDMTPAAERACNDIKGRLWDVLWMFTLAARRRDAAELLFELRVVVDRIRPSRVQLKSVIGPGDDGEPVITIMQPGQD